MSVREHDRLDIARRDRRVLPILFAPLLGTLEHSTIDECLVTLPSVKIG